jgi:hypothetical protein
MLQLLNHPHSYAIEHKNVWFDPIGASLDERGSDCVYCFLHLCASRAEHDTFILSASCLLVADARLLVVESIRDL